MAQNSKIEWTHHTANLWWGCTEVHTGCDNCYARTLAQRFGSNVWGNETPRREIRGVWIALGKMQNAAAKANELHRVFVGSMMDIFEKPMPVIDAAIPEYTTGVIRDRLFEQISEGWYPNLIFLFLTKRPGNINKYIPESWKSDPPQNVWFGTSPVDQPTANKLIPQLLEVCGNKFLSIEPQLGPIHLQGSCLDNFAFMRIKWIIQGGESGPRKRPFRLAWADQISRTCAFWGVPYFFKQIDKVQPIPDEYMIRQFPQSFNKQITP